MHTQCAVMMKHWNPNPSSFKCTYLEHTNVLVRTCGPTNFGPHVTQPHLRSSDCGLDLNDVTHDSSKKQKARLDKLEMNDMTFLSNAYKYK